MRKCKPRKVIECASDLPASQEENPGVQPPNLHVSHTGNWSHRSRLNFASLAVALGGWAGEERVATALHYTASTSGKDEARMVEFQAVASW